MLDCILLRKETIVLDNFFTSKNAPSTKDVVSTQSVESIKVLLSSNIAIIILLSHQIESVILNSWNNLDLLVVSEVDNSL